MAYHDSCQCELAEHERLWLIDRILEGLSELDAPELEAVYVVVNSMRTE